jgi:hypothetical protein
VFDRWCCFGSVVKEEISMDVLYIPPTEVELRDESPKTSECHRTLLDMIQNYFQIFPMTAAANHHHQKQTCQCLVVVIVEYLVESGE